MCPFVDIVTLFLLSMFSQKRTTRNPSTINQHFAKAFEYEKEREELREARVESIAWAQRLRRTNWRSMVQ